MRYSIEPRDRLYVKGYGLLSFANNMARNLSNMVKNISIVLKNLQKTIKTASKRAIPKTAEATSDLIGNKIADKITSVSKKISTKELHNNDETKEEDVEITTHKKRYISPEKRQQIIDELRVVPKSYV